VRRHPKTWRMLTKKRGGGGTAQRRGNSHSADEPTIAKEGRGEKVEAEEFLASGKEADHPPSICKKGRGGSLVEKGGIIRGNVCGYGKV